MGNMNQTPGSTRDMPHAAWNPRHAHQPRVRSHNSGHVGSEAQPRPKFSLSFLRTPPLIRHFQHQLRIRGCRLRQETLGLPDKRGAEGSLTW
jgi:hypothetical protein